MLNPAPEVEDRSGTASLPTALADYAAASLLVDDSVAAAARLCLIAGLGRAFEALRDPGCASRIGPLVPGALMPGGARVPGTSLELDPVQAAFCNGLLLYPAAGAAGEPGVPRTYAADSLGPILAVADYQARKAVMEGGSPPNVREVLAAIAKAARIQSVLGSAADPDGSEPAPRLTRVATAAIAAAQLGGDRKQIVTALSYAWVDSGTPIEADERDAVGRRGWATADSVSRAIRHACQAIAGQLAQPTASQLAAMGGAGSSLPSRSHVASRLFDSNACEPLAGLGKSRGITQVTSRFQAAVACYFPARQAERIKALFAVPQRLDELPVNELLAALVTNGSR